MNADKFTEFRYYFQRVLEGGPALLDQIENDRMEIKLHKTIINLLSKDAQEAFSTMESALRLQIPFYDKSSLEKLQAVMSKSTKDWAEHRVAELKKELEAYSRILEKFSPDNDEQTI